MRRTRTSRVNRIAPTRPTPELTIGYGYADPTTRQADLIDAQVRPLHRRAGTMVMQYGVNRPQLPRAAAVFLQDDNGAEKLLVGDSLTGSQTVN